METKLLKKIQDQILKDEEESRTLDGSDIAFKYFKEALFRSKSVSELVANLSPYYYNPTHLYKIIINILDKL